MNSLGDFYSSLTNSFHEKKMATIAYTLLELGCNESVKSELPDVDTHVLNFIMAIADNDPSVLEHELINLYAHLHQAGSSYSSSEKKQLTDRNGYTCHPGGLVPLIKAEPFIQSESIVADLGAGNGLQGLLLQRLYPHQKTLQIELSAEMIRVGRLFQEVLGISDDRVGWIHDDIINVSLDTADFIYLYLPARPQQRGQELYQAIAHKLALRKNPVIIFSAWDCLGQFLDKRYSTIYSDGHLICFSNNTP